MLNKKFIISNPPKSAVVIFDETNNKYITELILKDLPSEIFYVRKEKIYISLKIIYLLLLSFKNSKLKLFNNSSNLLKTILKELINHHRLICLGLMKPKVVITFIDNSPIYHWLKMNYKEADFIAIQNGCRMDLEIDSERAKHHHQHFFCFGEYDKDRYIKFGHQVENFYPIGSLLAGYNQCQKLKDKGKSFDLAIPSGYRGNLKNIKVNSPDHWWFNTYFENEEKVYKYIARFSEEFNLNVVILLRNTKKEMVSEEKNYFLNFFSSNIEFAHRSKNRFSSYQVVEKAEVTIGFCSTLLCEVFGLGAKILKVDFSDSNKYNDYEKLIMFNDENYESFKEHLNKLLNEPNESYKKRMKDYSSYVMNNQINNPPHIMINEMIKSFL